MNRYQKFVIVAGAYLTFRQVVGILADSRKRMIYKTFETKTVSEWTTERDNRLIDTRFEDIIHREGL